MQFTGGLKDTHLLQQIRCQHENLRVRPEALHSSKISHALLVIFGRRHDLENVEGRPRHVVADHLQVYQLEERRGLDICPPRNASASLVRTAPGVNNGLTHVLAANLGTTFFQGLLDELLLVALVVPQASDEVVERLFEPVVPISIRLAGSPSSGIVHGRFGCPAWGVFWRVRRAVKKGWSSG